MKTNLKILEELNEYNYLNILPAGKQIIYSNFLFAGNSFGRSISI